MPLPGTGRCEGTGGCPPPRDLCLGCAAQHQQVQHPKTPPTPIFSGIPPRYRGGWVGRCSYLRGHEGEVHGAGAGAAGRAAGGAEAAAAAAGDGRGAGARGGRRLPPPQQRRHRDRHRDQLQLRRLPARPPPGLCRHAPAGRGPGGLGRAPHGPVSSLLPGWSCRG